MKYFVILVSIFIIASLAYEISIAFPCKFPWSENKCYATLPRTPVYSQSKANAFCKSKGYDSFTSIWLQDYSSATTSISCAYIVPSSSVFDSTTTP